LGLHRRLIKFLCATVLGTKRCYPPLLKANKLKPVHALWLVVWRCYQTRAGCDQSKIH